MITFCPYYKALNALTRVVIPWIFIIDGDKGYTREEPGIKAGMEPIMVYQQM
jgi:hypothetical protein